MPRYNDNDPPRQFDGGVYAFATLLIVAAITLIAIFHFAKELGL